MWNIEKNLIRISYNQKIEDKNLLDIKHLSGCFEIIISSFFTLKFFSQNNKLYIKNFLTSQKATNTFTVNQLENVRAIYPKTDDIQRRADEGQDIM